MAEIIRIEAVLTNGPKPYLRSPQRRGSRLTRPGSVQDGRTASFILRVALGLRSGHRKHPVRVRVRDHERSQCRHAARGQHGGAGEGQGLAPSRLPGTQPALAIRVRRHHRQLRFPGRRPVRGTDIGGAVDPGHRAGVLSLIGVLWLHRSVVPAAWGVCFRDIGRAGSVLGDV